MNAARIRPHRPALTPLQAQAARVAKSAALAAPDPSAPDLGADGPASLARSSRVVRVDGTIRGAGQKRATPVYARRVDASTLFERMNNAGQLSDRQARAGLKLLLLARTAYLHQRVTARPMTEPNIDDDGEDEGEMEVVVPEPFDARTYHRHLLRQLPAAMAAMVERACDWTPEQQVGHPGVRFLATFQIALTRLADLMELPHE